MAVYLFSESVSRILNEMIDFMMVYIRKLMSWDNSTKARNPQCHKFVNYVSKSNNMPGIQGEKAKEP